MTRPKTGADPGWPRPLLTCTADTGPQVIDRACETRRDRPRPVPWLAEQDASGWDPWEFDEDRAATMRELDLCQVCGELRGDTVYGIVTAADRRDRLDDVAHFGGALCSLRCARLTAAVCPHYREMHPVDIYAVPNPGERVECGLGDANDDALDVTQPAARHIATVGGQP